MTMAKFLRPVTATSTVTQDKDKKVATLTETQRQQVLEHNRRKLNDFLEIVMVTKLEQRHESLRFAHSDIALRFEVPSSDCEVLHITCELMTLDCFDSRIALRRKCRRLNANISGAVLRMNKRNQIELLYMTPMETLTFNVFEHVLKLLEDVATDCEIDLHLVRNKSRWGFAIE
jgi:hypothetical protein